MIHELVQMSGSYSLTAFQLARGSKLEGCHDNQQCLIYIDLSYMIYGRSVALENLPRTVSPIAIDEDQKLNYRIS